MVCASSSRRAETTFFSCLGSTFGIRAIFCPPRADLIQSFRLLLLQLCRRRSEEICWTTWAVATPDARGVVRLKSRSKWGRYRPKSCSLLAPFPRSFLSHLLCFWLVVLAAVENLAAKPNESRFGTGSRPRSILLRRLQIRSRSVHILIYMAFVGQGPETSVDPTPEIRVRSLMPFFSRQLSAPIPRGSVKTDSEEPHTRARNACFPNGKLRSALCVTSASARLPLLHCLYRSSNRFAA